MEFNKEEEKGKSVRGETKMMVMMIVMMMIKEEEEGEEDNDDESTISGEKEEEEDDGEDEHLVKIVDYHAKDASKVSLPVWRRVGWMEIRARVAGKG